jgi:hypothetical protein
MPTLIRGFTLVAALSLSTTVFAQANQEGNAPANNAAATAPKMSHAHHYRHHHRRHHHPMTSPGDQRMGNGSNGTSPNNGVSGDTNPGGAQTTNPQSNQ